MRIFEQGNEMTNTELKEKTTLGIMGSVGLLNYR